MNWVNMDWVQRMSESMISPTLEELDGLNEFEVGKIGQNICWIDILCYLLSQICNNSHFPCKNYVVVPNLYAAIDAPICINFVRYLYFNLYAIVPYILLFLLDLLKEKIAEDDFQTDSCCTDLCCLNWKLGVEKFQVPPLRASLVLF